MLVRTKALRAGLFSGPGEFLRNCQNGYSYDDCHDNDKSRYSVFLFFLLLSQFSYPFSIFCPLMGIILYSVLKANRF